MKTYTYYLSSFPHESVNAEKLRQTILESAITVQLAKVVFGELGVNQCDITFDAPLPWEEKQLLDGSSAAEEHPSPPAGSIIGDHDATPVDPTVTESIYSKAGYLERETVFADESRMEKLKETVYTYSDKGKRTVLLKRVVTVFRQPSGVASVQATSYLESTEADGGRRVIASRS